MSDDAESSRQSWHPFTFGNVAGLAGSPAGRTLLMGLGIAFVSASLVVWFVSSAWVPIVDRAVAGLPQAGDIREGRLHWPSGEPARLAEGPFLSVVVDPLGEKTFGQSADLQCEFRLTELRIYSLFGYLAIPYGREWEIAFNRRELQPVWGAWHPVGLAAIGAGTFVGLWTAWIVLACAYLVPARVTAFYRRREATTVRLWKLGFASLMPGAVFMCLAILLYHFGRLSLAGFLIAVPLHLVIGWVFLLGGAWKLPEHSPVPANPFVTQPESSESENPFAPGAEGSPESDREPEPDSGGTTKE